MAKYELTFLFDKKNEEMIEAIEKMLEEVKAKIVSKEDWGVKRLAYIVKGLKEAHYVYFEAEITEKDMIKLMARIRLNEKIIRELIVRV